jgi:hypothetical protein
MMKQEAQKMYAMTFNLHQLDHFKDLDDQAIEASEDYALELIDQFRESPEGQAWMSSGQVDAEVAGGWIDNVLHYGFAYLNVTLPKMNAQNVNTILTDLFPQKVSLLDPEEAETAIPELLAFWKFIKRVYKLSQANAIIKALETLKPKFKDIMNDSSRFGMAKIFMQSGLEAGFDMTSEEGLKAFQDQFNQALQEGATIHLPELGLGISMLSDLFDEADEDENESGLSEIDELSQSLRARFSSGTCDDVPMSQPLSPETITLLTQHTITAENPGSIVQDFQIFLDAIGTKGVPVSGARYNLPTKLLAELNASVAQPIALDFQRPVQKSYPNISGLYLLAKASGLAYLEMSGKKPGLVLNTTALAQWKQLNPTEQYLTLLEAWLLRACPEMLGEPSEGRFQLNDGSRCLRFWQFRSETTQKFSKYSEQSMLQYFPNLYNIALMQMFGFITIQSAKPEKGMGWRIKAITKLPWGDAVLHAFLEAAEEQDYMWPVDADPYAPLGALQPVFQPYFPEWQNTLSIQKPEFRPGVHTFKVCLGKAWRRIAIAGNLYLDHLSDLILESVDFDSDHLDVYRYQDITGQTLSVYHPFCDEGPFTNAVRVGDIPLTIGMSMTYIFDFGDRWEFQVTLESVAEVHPKADYGEILEQHGKAPVQYPQWEEED